MNAYDDWVSLYNDNLSTAWAQEKIELRRISMIYNVLENELMRVKNQVSGEIKQIRLELKRRDTLEKCKKFTGLAQSERFDFTQKETNKENLPSPVPLRNVDLNEANAEELFIESPDKSTIYETCHPEESQNYAIARTSPTINKSRFSNLKRTNPTSPSLLYPVIAHKVEKVAKLGEKSKITPNSSIIDSSVIELTPVLKPVKKHRSIKCSQNKSKKKKTQTTTLTQMFWEPKKKKEKKIIDSNMASMNIEDILEVINQSSDETDTECDNVDDNATIDGGTKMPENMNVSARFIENYDKVPETTSTKFDCTGVVRGKERLKLKGWSCKECENYYEGLGLSPEEIQKKKNECSKHRHATKPRDETFRGFWDLTFGPSPKTQNNTSPSMVFNYRKK